ncbi:MAG: hypothetical protein MZV70_76025 [Desulfobacterales bacterium]|nr:hypothetical protein [Desulfobacterales bacterium]
MSGPSSASRPGVRACFMPSPARNRRWPQVAPVMKQMLKGFHYTGANMQIAAAPEWSSGSSRRREPSACRSRPGGKWKEA